MALKSYQFGMLASFGSFVLLAGAWMFQAIGYAPCAICIWQRYPHAAAILLGLLVLIGLRHKFVYFLGALAAAATSGIGLYHTGIERDWWEGPTTCTGTGLDLSQMSVSDLLPTSTDQPALVMCDQVTWEFLTLSMASWNALFSLVLVVLWVFAFIKRA